MKKLLSILLFFISTTLFAQNLDANGWTIFEPSSDSRIVYVSASLGNDATAQFYAYNDPEINGNPFQPQSTILPYQTLSAAFSQIRNGYADWVLLKDDEIFNAPNIPLLNLNGRSKSEPILISSYGNSGNRPTLLSASTNLFNFSGNANNIAIVGLHGNASLRSPTDEPIAINILNAPFSYFLVENCYFENYASNIVVQDYNSITSYTHKNFIARRNILINSYLVGGNASGVYMYNIDSIYFFQNLIDHNGWDENISGAGANGFSHNTYFHPSCGFLDFSENIVSRASAVGIGARCGGKIFNNLLIENPRNILIGSFDPSQINWPTEAAESEVSYNVVLGSRVDSYDPGNGISLERVRNSYIHHNILAHFTEISDYNNGFGLNYFENIKLSKNIIYNWTNNLNSGPSYASAVFIGTNRLGNSSIDSNKIQLHTLQAYCINNNGSNSNISFSGNSYYNIISNPNWFNTGSYTDWINNNSELGSSNGIINFLDPNRNIHSYMTLIGGASSVEDFINAAKNQTKSNWNLDYTAAKLNDYIRVGFNEEALLNYPETQIQTLRIYPNPTTQYLKIDVTNGFFYQIIGTDGKIYQNAYSSGQIDVSNLKTGIYFIKTEGKFTKFIKQ